MIIRGRRCITGRNKSAISTFSIFEFLLDSKNLIRKSVIFTFFDMKLGLLLSGAVRALDIQSQFRAYIDTAYPSCQAVIAKCERPFIGYDVKDRVLDVQSLNTQRNILLMISLSFFDLEKTRKRKNVMVLSFLRHAVELDVLVRFVIFSKMEFLNVIICAN